MAQTATWIRGQKAWFNDFLFHNMIQKLNADLEEQGQPVVKTSHARHLRRKMDSMLEQLPELQDNARSMKTATSQPVVLAFCAVVRNDKGIVGSEKTLTQLSDQSYKTSYIVDVMKQFKGLTGIRTGSESYQVTPVDPRGGEWLPISPYTPELENRDCVIQLGSDMGLMRRADVEQLIQVHSPKDDAITYDNMTTVLGAPDVMGPLYQAKVYRQGKDANGQFTTQPVADVYNEHDASGVAALRAFMSDKEFAEITSDYNGSPWTSAAKGPDGKPLYMDDASISRVRDLVATLRSRGDDFEFKKDSRPGQVCIQFGVNKMQLRVIDPYDPQFAGARVYDEGFVVQMQTQDRSERENSWATYVPRTSRECLDLVDVAMGREVLRWDHQSKQDRVGSPKQTAGRGRKMNESFHSSDGSFRATIGQDNEGRPVSVYFKKHSRTGSKIFKQPEDAENYLRDMVNSSRERFETELDVEMLIDLAAQHEANPEEYGDAIPMYSQDPVIKAVQEKYWRTLTDREAPLLIKPEYVTLDEEDNEHITADIEDFNDAMYDGSPADQVRAHAKDMARSAVGEYLGPGLGPQFDPVLVSRYATNGYSMFRNNDDIMSAMRRAGHVPEDLTGNAFYNDVVRSRLISFNPETGKPIQLQTRQSPFMNMVFQTVGKAIKDQGCEVLVTDDVRPNPETGVMEPYKRCHIDIDDNGIIRYEARMKTRQRVEGKSSDSTLVIGEIGQIFEPDEHGVVHTKTHLFVPGYEGVVTPNKIGENKPYEERIKLRGYEQVIEESIRDQIHQTFISSMREEDVMENGVRTGEKIRYAGNPTGLNRAIQHLYDTRLPLDFYESHLEGGSREGISQELQQAIIDTCRGRIKLDNDLMEESGRQNLYRNAYRPGATYDKFNDNKLDGISLTDARNPAILEEPGDGLFDPYFTGNGPAQGNIRYLAEGATVGSDGYIVPSKDRGARCPLVKYMQKQGRQPDFDAVDRMCMSGNGLLQGLRETRPVGMAQVTFGFQTFEDGIVISKEFAEENRVPDAHAKGPNGETVMRPLKSGDKIECHGNKGVVSLVVDRGMDLDEAEKLGIREAVEWYRENPGLDVVMSPYSAVSRFNAGMAREAIASKPETLIAPDGTAYPGALGHVRMTVLKQTVDTKSHSNTEDGQQRRSYGAQLSWALAANDCTKVMEDSYSDNFKALADVREYLIACGMDMDETGRFRYGYQPHAGEQRNVFAMPELDYTDSQGNISPNMTVNKNRMREAFTKEIATRGGFVELPFALKYPTGKTFVEAESSTPDRKVYMMPIMSSFMRAGQEFQSGESVTHDYTNEYIRVFERSIEYRDAEARKLRAASVEEARAAEQAGTMTTAQKATLDQFGAWYDKTMADFDKKRHGSMSYAEWCDSEMETAVSNANSDYAKITRNITEKRFATKHNIWRTGIMANKQVDSATAVWHPDPTCPVDAVRMGSEMAETLGLARRDRNTGDIVMKPGAMALIHRDPVLRGSGIRYMRVELDPELVGISVHPAGIPGGMDGDFDGDSVGVHVPTGVDAKAEAREKLTVGANLLDRSSYDPKTGRYKLFIADGQDVAAGWAADDERRRSIEYKTGKPAEGLSLRERYEELEIRVNDFERQFAEGQMTRQKVVGERAKAVHDVQSYLTDCAKFGFGRHVLSYASPEAHIQSIERYVDDGAKGSLGKVQTYAKYAGIEYETTADGHLKPGTTVMHDKTLASRDDHIGILKAKNMQQQYTGTGGSFSIRAMRALTNVCPDEASRLNYLATQGVLQSKHDPHMSDRFEHILSGAARDLWRGYKLERVGGESLKNMSFGLDIDPRTGKRTMMTYENDTQVVNWRTVRGEDGQPVRATPEEFVEQFMDVYGSKDGLGLKVNPLLVKQIADVCSQPDAHNPGKRTMMSIEPEEGRSKTSGQSACDRYAAPLQKLAYDGTFDTIRQLADKQRDDPSYPGLFDVPDDPNVKRNYNRAMADAVMRHNLDVRDAMDRAAEAGDFYDGESFKPIVRPDVVVTGRHRNIRGVAIDTGRTAEQRAKQDTARRKKQSEVVIEDTVTPREIDYGVPDDDKAMSKL